MAIFGQRPHHHGSKAAPTPATATARAKKQHPFFAQSSYHLKSEATVKHPNDQNPNGKLSRSSRLMKLGEVLKNRLLDSRSHRLNRRLSKANEEMLPAIKESSERDFTSKHHRSCEDAAQKMEDVLFSVGGAERVVKNLQYFKDRAAVE